MGNRYDIRVKRATPAERTTQLLSVGCPGDVQFAAGLLRAGNLVAIPTETVYGLAAHALNARAVQDIFAAKQRPAWDPLIVHVSDRTMLRRIAREVSAAASKLMEAFWPGPLTLLLPKCKRVPQVVTAGRDLVGVRMPSHSVALEVIQAARVPLAAPSANLFGHVSPTRAEHVLNDLRGRIHAVLDAGPCAIGVESTVLDPATMMIYRQGGVSAADLERVTGQHTTIYVPGETEGASQESLPAPGVGLRHYAPHARLLLVTDEDEMRKVLLHADPSTTGVMQPTGWMMEWEGRAFSWSDWDDTPALARSLYRGLRQLDMEGLETIVCPLPAPQGDTFALALRDRLLKAARSA